MELTPGGDAETEMIVSYITQSYLNHILTKWAQMYEWLTASEGHFWSFLDHFELIFGSTYVYFYMFYVCFWSFCICFSRGVSFWII